MELSTKPQMSITISISLDNLVSFRTFHFLPVLNNWGLHFHFHWIQYSINKTKRSKIKTKWNHKHLNKINVAPLLFDYTKKSMSFCYFSDLLLEWTVYKTCNILLKWTGEGEEREGEKEEEERRKGSDQLESSNLSRKYSLRVYHLFKG